MEAQLVLFASVLDAQKVKEQLPEARIIGTQIYHRDKRALQAAINLASVDDYEFLGGRNKLYPQHEREYNGTSPRIYVACLSAYNSGHSHGLWVDATQEAESIQEDISWMLFYSPVAHVEVCEEFAIHDYEGFGCYHLSAYENLETVSAIANAIHQHGEVLAAFIACEYPDNRDIKDWDLVVEQFQSAYVGHFENEKHFALNSEEVAEIYNFKALQEQFPFWAGHIDWEGVALDLFCSDYYYTKATGEEYGIYVFRNCWKYR